MQLEKVAIFDFEFISASNIEDVVEYIFNDISGVLDQQFEFLITPNAYQLVHYNEKENCNIKLFYSHSSYILPDGMPVVWFSALLKNKLKSRLTGSNLFPVLWQEVKTRLLPVTFVLPDISIQGLFLQEYSLCNCFVPDRFTSRDEKYITAFAEIAANGIIQNKSRFVFLGLGFPKQEILGMYIYEKLKEKEVKTPVFFLLLGASFEFYFGMKKRAPELIQKTGFEWLYRFVKEPRRLWKRYTIDNLRFLALVIKEIRKTISQRLTRST